MASHHIALSIHLLSLRMGVPPPPDVGTELCSTWMDCAVILSRYLSRLGFSLPLPPQSLLSGSCWLIYDVDPGAPLSFCQIWKVEAAPLHVPDNLPPLASAVLRDLSSQGKIRTTSIDKKRRTYCRDWLHQLTYTSVAVTSSLHMTQFPLYTFAFLFDPDNIL